MAYLFGSQVSGYTHKASDVDIAVLLNEGIKAEEYFEKSLRLPKYFSDLFPKRTVSVIILNESPPLLKHQVLSQGILVADLQADERVKFELQTVREYEDTKHLRQIQSYYLSQRIREGSFAEP